MNPMNIGVNSDEALSYLQIQYNKALINKDLIESLKGVKKEAGKYKKVISKKQYKLFMNEITELFMNGITEAIQEFDNQIKRENLLSKDPFNELTKEEWRGYV
ncbi:hypothetical protein [Carnobacterium sp. TMP28]|uniref:hypothetical protein n=1 Tax=Carnobacterium sp. TMP28 TaxID=3397060 RepID=UPI0039DFE256